MKLPLVSIILATYNGSKYIKESIESVLKQSYSNFEFIIINDSSTDNVEKIILNFKSKDKRIVYIKNKKNLKLTKSLNKGLKIAKGKYIARIDDDDIWLKSKLEKQIKFMEKNINYGLCGTSTIVIDKNGKEIQKKLKRITNNDIKNNILKSNQFTHSSIVIRKGILNKVGGLYNKNYNGAEDYLLWLEIGKISKLYNLSDFLTKYRWLDTSISRKKWLKQRLLTFKIILINIKYYPNKLTGVIANIVTLFLPQNIINIIVKLYNKF